MVVLAALALTTGRLADVQLLHDFRDVTVWALNRDGGQGVRVSADAAQGMRVHYADAAPHWGNLVGPCSTPPRAAALRLRLTKHTSDRRAAMHIWLLEPDGDAWVQEVRHAGVPFGEWGAGRATVDLAVGAFTFEARGPGTRQMPTANRMLIGCNYGDLVVTVERMEWIMGQPSATQATIEPSSVAVEDGPLGCVGILEMAGPLPGGWKPPHAPRALAAALREGGFGVTMLRPEDLADPRLLRHAVLDAVVLPYGPYFPASARESFLGYLKDGGSFLSADGYAFDSLVASSGNGWADVVASVVAEDTARATAAGAGGMNTRHGQRGDAMHVSAEQIGAFDPAYKLEACVAARASEWSRATALRAPEYRWSRPLAGFAACALTGDNNPVFPPTYRRWLPILDGKDADGRDRGPVLAMVRNHGGAFRGSSWAFSGVTSGEDLFLRGAARRRLLTETVLRLARGVFLHTLRTEYAHYRVGEVMRFSVAVACYGRKPFAGTLRLRIGDVRLSRGVRIEPNKETIVNFEARAMPARSGFVPTVAELRDGGTVVDAINGGVSIESRSAIALGPRIAWERNYFTLNGKPQILVGSNQTGMMFYAEGEGPATWERDFAMMSRAGLRVLRILHFSPFAAQGYEGKGANSPSDLARRPERLCRQMDAIVQTAQRHGIVIFLTLHDWMPVALTDSDLQHQREWNRFWAARYRDVPGIIYDVQNEPSVDVPDRPDIVALWNRWLVARYGSDEAIRRAWHASPPESALPAIPLAAGLDRWDNVRAADRKRFEEYLLNRWAEANVKGVKDGDPDALVCIGYLPSMSPADKVLGAKHTDFSNMHYYGPVDGLADELAFADRRAYGKGLTLGEFGAMEAHARRNAGGDGVPSDASVERFAHTVHVAVGMGASMVCNWSLKEMDPMVFPWGLYQRNTPVPKPWADTYSAMARALATFEPEYRQPDVYVLVPDAHRVGPRFDDLHAGVRRAVGVLLDLNVPFAILNEEDLADPPASARAIIWPMPYCPNDAAFDAVLRWVRAGGVLYLSGGVAFDASRRPTRGDRMAALGLTGGLTVPFEPWTGAPVQRSAVGKGRVIYSPDPIELRDTTDLGALYAEAVSDAGARPIPVRAEQGRVRAQRVPGRDGTSLYVFERMDDGDEHTRVAVKGTAVSVTLGRRECAFVLVDRTGKATRL